MKKTLDGTILFLPDNITKSAAFSNYSIAVYSVIKMLTSMTGLQQQCVDPYQIAYLLTEDENISKHMLNCIKLGIEELIQGDILTRVNEVRKHYILNCSKLWVDTEVDRFTIITFQEVQSIFKAENVNNFMLLRYFVFLIGTISSKIDVHLNDCEHKNRVVGVLTIAKISELSGIPIRSIYEYNKVLEKENLIYIHRQNDFAIGENNGIKQLPNVYGRPQDKGFIEAYAIEQQKYNRACRCIGFYTTNVNNNRRLAQMYQQLLKNKGKDYTEEEIMDIYNYVVSENKKYLDLYENTGYTDYIGKMRKTDIFEKYDFINK